MEKELTYKAELKELYLAAKARTDIRLAVEILAMYEQDKNPVNVPDDA